jgi:GT2 family glycosyltransferase
VVDQSDAFQRKFYETFDLLIKVIPQKEKLLWTARNKAITLTDSNYLLFFDDDSRVESDWILQHLKCIDYFKADISAGVSLAPGAEKIPNSYNFFRWADQFDSGNAMVKRKVFEQIGEFDEQFNKQRMGDGEFGLRAYVNGLKSISNPRAYRYHLKGSTGGLREMGSWDGFRSKKWFAPKPIPSVIYLYKKYYPPYLYRNTLFIGILLSNIPYKHKRSSAMLLLSVFLTVLKAPVLTIQFYKSAQIAKKMLLQNQSTFI